MARKVRIATISTCWQERKTEIKKVEDNLEYIRKTVEEISVIKPDLIVIPEAFQLTALPEGTEILAPGKELLMDLAKKHKTNIIGCLYEKRQGKKYNTSLVIDRKGKIIGRYDKIHLVEGEMTDIGVTPGKKDQPPIKTDIGKIGIQVCFDANWHDEWERLVADGADLIVFPSAFPGGRILESISLLNHVFVVASTWTLDYTGILNNTGQWLTRTDRFSSWVWSEIDLERTVFHWDYQKAYPKDILKKYGDKIKIETFGPEGWFVLEPNSPEISMPKIIKEFNLVKCRDYFKRATAAQDKMR